MKKSILIATAASAFLAMACSSKTDVKHEAVDLGLSVKWATCNVGASSPSDYGDYFAWGETATKSTYMERNSKTNNKSIDDISGNVNYDAARANWGGKWRMPTKAEMEELVNKCTWTKTIQGGHNGYKVTSKINGNSIFLPAAGFRSGLLLEDDGEYGYYWSATPGESDTQWAYELYFSRSSHDVRRDCRDFGHGIRPVSD